MANRVLYWSSVVHGVIILAILVFTSQQVPVWFSGMIVALLATSLLNHGLTNNAVRFMDRLMTFFLIFVFIGFIVKESLPYRELLVGGFVLTLFLVVFSKAFEGKSRLLIHLSSHIIGTVCVLGLIWVIVSRRREPQAVVDYSEIIRL